MKQRTTTPVSSKSFRVKVGLVAAAVLMGIAAPIQITQVAKADEFDDRIQAIQNEINQYQSKAGELRDRANSLQKEVDSLNAQKNVIQGQIDLKQAEYDKLIASIKDNENKIAVNQEVLGDTITDMYLDDNLSTLEMLASSENIGEYVDKQEYRTTMRDTLTGTITDIKRIKAELEQQKKDVERVMAEQKLARDELARKESEQASLVAQTRGEEAAYNNLTADREQKKLQVQQEQQAAIEAAMRRASGGGSIQVLPGDPNKGGYPWEVGCWVDGNAWSHGGADGMGGDPLGYGCRQCVSYAAYKFGAQTGNYPRYWGNANMWPGSARAAGYRTGSTPRVNSVGVISAGQYGHVVWVEAVHDDGTVTISQYNYWNAGGPGWGNYSRMRVSAATYDTYVYTN